MSINWTLGSFIPNPVSADIVSFMKLEDKITFALSSPNANDIFHRYPVFNKIDSFYLILESDDKNNLIVSMYSKRVFNTSAKCGSQKAEDFIVRLFGMCGSIRDLKWGLGKSFKCIFNAKIYYSLRTVLLSNIVLLGRIDLSPKELLGLRSKVDTLNIFKCELNNELVTDEIFEKLCNSNFYFLNVHSAINNTEHSTIVQTQISDRFLNSLATSLDYKKVSFDNFHTKFTIEGIRKFLMAFPNSIFNFGILDVSQTESAHAFLMEMNNRMYTLESELIIIHNQHFIRYKTRTGYLTSFSLSLSTLSKESDIDFRDETTPHDRIVVVQGQNFYVNSEHLSLHSEYFNLIFQAKKQKEIELKDIEADAFEIFLKMLYQGDAKETSDNLPFLMKLSKILSTPVVWQKCINYLENSDIQQFKLEDLLDWTEWTGSETLKKNVEKHCIESFKEVELARFAKTAADFNFCDLQEYIIKKVFTDKGIVLNQPIVNMILAQDFAKSYEKPVYGLIQSNRPDKIETLYTFIMMLKYYLPQFEDWFSDNFDRLILNPLSGSNIQILMGKLENLSSDHKHKLEIVVSKSADLMKGKLIDGNHKKGLRNFLPEISFLLYKDDLKTLLTKAYDFVKDFPCLLKIEDLQKVFDRKFAKIFNRTNNFESIEIVVQNNFTETKTAMTNYLKTVNCKRIGKNIALIRRTKSSPDVANFIRGALHENKQKYVILKAIFG